MNTKERPSSPMEENIHHNGYIHNRYPHIHLKLINEPKNLPLAKGVNKKFFSNYKILPFFFVVVAKSLNNNISFSVTLK